SVYLPFLRRYIPAAVFPCFMLFFPLAWRALTGATRRHRLSCAATAGACFAVCVYGYFYMWTAQAAWLALMALLWLVCKPAGWREALKSCALVGAIGALALVPYFVLLAHRAETMDVAQALVYTHAPDILRSIEACALVIISALAFGLRRKRFDVRDPALLCALAFALLPFVLFNQQVLTGRSLQPMHYEQFVAPYVTLIAAALAASLLWRGRVPGRKLPLAFVLAVAYLAYLWGCGETWVPMRRFAAANVERDEVRAVGLRLREIARNYARQGFVRYALFGWERANPKLTATFQPVTDEELALEAHNYADYIARFDRTRATHPTLSYLFIAADQTLNFAHLERWYTRDRGERIGPYVLYRLKLRQ